MYGFQLFAKIVFALIFFDTRLDFIADRLLNLFNFDFFDEKFVKNTKFILYRVTFENALFVGFFEVEIVSGGVTKRVGVFVGEYRGERFFYVFRAYREKIITRFVFDEAAIRLGFGGFAVVGENLVYRYRKVFVDRIYLRYSRRVKRVYVYP